MARDLYPGVLIQIGGGSAAPAPNLPFRVWTDLFAGDDVTDQLVGPDGTSDYDAKSDAQGNLLPFRGPEDYQGNLFADTGVGMRYLLLSPTLVDWIVDQLVSLLAQIAAGEVGGGIPAGSTLDSIGDSATRFALTPAQKKTLETTTDLAAVDARLTGTLRVLRATSGGTGSQWTDGKNVYDAGARPAYAGPIQWMSSLARKPAADGVLTGGGGMVPNIDTWVQWVAQ